MCDVEREELLKEQKALQEGDDSKLTKDEIREVGQQLQHINTRLLAIQAEKAESKAIKILIGLGFMQKDLNTASSKFSGGWRMRIAIAKVIFCEPEILLLDEPTNHLDLNALLWLEEYILCLDITVVIVSHAKEFLNAVCEEIIYFFN
jgi:ATP-binding cassette subfamily F protein 3